MLISEYSDEKLIELRQTITNRLKQEQNYELALKEVGNAIYGCHGSSHYEFAKKEIAESITTQGRELIKYTNKAINLYFKQFYFKDIELHNKIGVTEVSEISDDVVIYNDTDSAFVDFEPIILASNYNGAPNDFIDMVFEHRLNAYIKQVFNKYATKYNTENIMSIKVEHIIDSIVFFGKKNYIYKIKDKITPVGFKPLLSSAPKYSRLKIYELLEYIFSSEFNISELTERIKSIKKQFKIQKIETLCETITVNNIDEFILDDFKEFVVKEGCSYHVQASGLHNHLLNKNKQFGRYRKIQSGDKVRIYHCKFDYFAFLPNLYPYEFAPEIDYEKQFNKSILSPINQILDKLGHKTISESLIIKIK